MRRSYWDWHDQIAANATGAFPFTPATNLLYGLKEAIDMLHEEGLDQVFARHDRHAEATRQAVQAWGRGAVSGAKKLLKLANSSSVAGWT